MKIPAKLQKRAEKTIPDLRLKVEVDIVNPVKRKTGFALIEKVELKRRSYSGMSWLEYSISIAGKHLPLSRQWDDFLRNDQEGLRVKAGD